MCVCVCVCVCVCARARVRVCVCTYVYLSHCQQGSEAMILERPAPSMRRKLWTRKSQAINDDGAPLS